MALRFIRLFAGLCMLSGILSAGPAAARPLQQILNEGVLRVGTTLAPPWAVRAADGALTGFEVDVAKQLAQDMGVRLDLQIYPWDRLIRGLEAGEVDLLAAGLSITPARALHVNFSRPYTEGGIALATDRQATATVTDLADLDTPDHTVGVITGSVAEELRQRVLPRSTAALFATAELASAALLAGEVDSLLAEEPLPTYLALEHPDRIDTPLAQPLLHRPIAFAISKGDADFLAFLDAWIAAREADTWLATIHAYWFETLHWRRALDNAAR